MPLFRFHRGSLEDSLKTTIVVKKFNDLVKAIVMSDNINQENEKWPFECRVAPYPEEGKNFDARIGWYTHVVLCNLCEKDKLHPIGFLSENF